ncbi:MAG: hypothetical protein A2W98_04975 [Bacteroidetes bacterium GWF2_33_38]|nr:MAG: hypothetical protein A2W98_04975 [Bacteroidetes bacterium GWF2_33_38]OFY75639.1 MAG: hypothetical protein A2265_00055 [Bacteroidetes bacterium RIFOXYA12_FULL_33_9]OFY90647.1 MAG: hypothetical protein A2236_02635 [Bacteroidetes bacterium RIFOXYA2_FULL_33_7]
MTIQRKIKIIHVVPDLRKGGGEKFLLDICNEMKSRENIEFIIITLDGTNEYKDISKDLNLIYCNVPIRLSIKKKSEVDDAEFVKIVNSFQPDIIHSHLYLAEIASRATIFPTVKYFSHLQGFEDRFVPFSIKTLLKKEKITNYFEKEWLINRYKKCNNNFFAISKNTLNYYSKHLPKQLQKNITLVHNAIPFERYFSAIHRKNTDIPIRLISVGSLIDRKNHELLLQALVHLKKSNVDFRLEILGEGNKRHFLEKSILEKDLSEKVFLIGNVVNVEDYLKNADIYLHAAKYEPFGLVIIEAMAAGLPVISLNGKGNKDIVLENYNGYLINDENSKLFAEKIIYLLNNQSVYSNLSNNAITFAKQFDIKECVNKIIKQYQIVLEN